MSVSRT